MNCTDPIADLLTRVRNGQHAKKDVVTIPASKVKIAVTHLLKQEGFIKNYKCVRDQKQGLIKVALKYDPSGNGVIKNIQRFSRPGFRRYSKKDEIPYVKNGFGVAILSTSKGVMTCREARQHNVGGEVLCTVY